MTPCQLAAKLLKNDRAVEELKVSETVPREILPDLCLHQIKFMEEASEKTQLCPTICHGRNHVPLANEETLQLLKRAVPAVLHLIGLGHMAGTASFEDELGSKVSRTILRSRTTSFAGKTMIQVQIHLKTAVPSQKLLLPVELLHKATLHRRHNQAGAAPGVDFFVPLDEETRPFLKTVQSIVMTVCASSPKPEEIGLGTFFCGTHFPGEDVSGTTSTDMVPTGILYKWYPNEEARTADAYKYAEAIPTCRAYPVLIEPVDYQNELLI
jgi:hypothetical protein